MADVTSPPSWHPVSEFLEWLNEPDPLPKPEPKPEMNTWGRVKRRERNWLDYRRTQKRREADEENDE